MKKILIFFAIVIIVISMIYGIYFNYKIKYNSAKKENLEYEYYYEKEIYGLELATLINRIVDENERNNIIKDENGYYISNQENSIILEIYMTDQEETYRFERIYKGDISNFVFYYDTIKFKCTKIEYHTKTGKVSYLLFNQITG